MKEETPQEGYFNLSQVAESQSTLDTPRQLPSSSIAEPETRFLAVVVCFAKCERVNNSLIDVSYGDFIEIFIMKPGTQLSSLQEQ